MADEAEALRALTMVPAATAGRAAFIIDGEEVDCGHVTPSMSTADVERQVREALAAMAARAPKEEP